MLLAEQVTPGVCIIIICLLIACTWKRPDSIFISVIFSLTHFFVKKKISKIKTKTKTKQTKKSTHIKYQKRNTLPAFTKSNMTKPKDVDTSITYLGLEGPLPRVKTDSHFFQGFLLHQTQKMPEHGSIRTNNQDRKKKLMLPCVPVCVHV